MYKHIWLFTCYTRYFQILRMSCLHWKSSRPKLPTMLLCEALWQKHHDLSTVKCQGILIAKAVMHSHTAAWMAHLDKELHSETYGSLGTSRQYFFRNAWTEFDWFIIMFTFHSFFFGETCLTCVHSFCLPIKALLPWKLSLLPKNFSKFLLKGT